MYPRFLAQIDISQDFEPATKVNTIGSLTNLIVSNLFIFAGLILFAGIIFGGFTLMTKGNNPEDLKKGKQLLTYSVAGFVIILLSYLLVKVLLQILGIQSPL